VIPEENTPSTQASTNDEARATSPPTQVGRRWINYVVGFSVGVGTGLSVYLGKVHVPLFSPLLDLIPFTLQNTLIPLSSALMGIVAVAIQFYSYTRLGPRRLGGLFVRTIAAGMTALLLFIIVHTYVVVTIDTTPTGRASFLVCFTRPERPPCPTGVSDAECITRLTMDPARISSFWGDHCLHTAQLALELTYLATTALFGALVGLIVLRGDPGRKVRA
jgi:hypothetical protein